VGLQLDSIEAERELKLRSLLSDRISVETERFWASLGRFKFESSQREAVEEAVGFNLNQDYGPRDLDKYYGVHPIRVARFMAEWLPESSDRKLESVIASLVHNAIEKKILSSEGVEERFGIWVRNAVCVLTPERATIATEEGKKAYYQRLANQDREVRALKLFDKFDNIFSLCLNPNEQVRTDYLDEIRKYVRPIAEELAPTLLRYFDQLVEETEKLGYYRPEFWDGN
jgi:(p)ppGpp synthase/HD superfamily hydrolase